MENNLQIIYLLLLAVAILVVVILYLKYRYSLRVIADLEQELGDKSEALEYTRLQLESSKTELKNTLAFRERAISIVVHDLKSPLAFLHRIIHHLHVSYRDIPLTEMEKLTGEMSYTTYQIVGFVNDLLDWLNANHVDFSLQQDIRPFNEFLEAKLAVYQDIAEKKGLQFALKAKPAFTLKADFNLLLIVIRNLLDNAIKNTDNGSISINGYADESAQYIVVSDTGNGMSNDKAIELQYGVITKKTNESSQIGFRIIYDLVVKMKGRIKIEKIPSGGTSIVVVLPK